MTEQRAPSDSVRVVLFDPALEQFLLVEEIDDDNPKLPGGKIEDGESDEQAALRELGEELGTRLDISSIRFVGQLPNKDGISQRKIFAGIATLADIEKTRDVKRVLPATLDAVPESRNKEHIISAAQLALAALKGSA